MGRIGALRLLWVSHNCKHGLFAQLWLLLLLLPDLKRSPACNGSGANTEALRHVALP